jgi:lysyl-tRNA synthetase class 2
MPGVQYLNNIAYTAGVWQERYKDLPNGQAADDSAKASVAGRVMNKRVMGKLAFLTLRDDRGQIQVVGTCREGRRPHATPRCILGA